MPLAVASRFAVLKIEGDRDDEPRKNPKKSGDGKSADSKKKSIKPDTRKVGLPVNQSNSGTKSKAKAVVAVQPKKKGGVAASDEQWAQWQKKDSQVADVNYEADLHNAILLSKVDFEKNKAVYNQRKKAAEEEKKVPTTSTKKSKKSNKPVPMSLDQFNNLNNEPDVEVPEEECNGNDLNGDEEFFDRIVDETKEAIEREESLALRKARQPEIYKAITQAQYEDALEKKDQQIVILNQDMVKLKEELHNVKTRNKRLCQILANGEMKEKAELLVELDRMYRVRDELSSEVASLHTQLEQERSKTHALTSDPKNKAQSKKRATSDSVQ